MSPRKQDVPSWFKEYVAYMKAKLAKRVVQNRVDSGQVSLMILAEGKTLWRGQTQQRGHQSSITFIELFAHSLSLSLSLSLLYF